MADLTIWISGADFIKMGEFLAPEGRRLFENGGGVFGRGRVDFSQTVLAGVGLRSATLAAKNTWGCGSAPEMTQ